MALALHHSSRADYVPYQGSCKSPIQSMCQARSTWHQAQKACVMRWRLAPPPLKSKPCLTSRSPIFKACALANCNGPLHHLPVKVQSREMAMGLEDLKFQYAQESAQCTMWEGGVRTCSDCCNNKVLVGACVEAPSEVGHLTTGANPLIEGRCGSYVFLTFDLNFGPSKR